MAPVDAQTKAQYDTAATAIETELNRMARQGEAEKALSRFAINPRF
jgi:hypothetical protein